MKSHHKMALVTLLMLLIYVFFGSDTNFKFLATQASIYLTVLWGYFELYGKIVAGERLLKEEIRLNKENRISESNLPVLIEILDDLYSLHQFFIYKGVFCPQVEHRSILLQFSDSENEYDGKMSYSQRTAQFYRFGLRTINNCRRVIFLSDQKHLPKTIDLCSEVKKYLCEYEEGKARNLDIMMRVMLSVLSGDKDVTDVDRCYEYAKDLLKFHDRLDGVIEKELSRNSDLYIPNQVVQQSMKATWRRLFYKAATVSNYISVN